MKITVDREHIEKGSRNSPSYCPIALAVREKFKMEPGEVLVYTDHIEIYDPRTLRYDIHPVPDDVSAWIVAFDQQLGLTLDDICPIEFETLPPTGDKA